MRIMDIRKRLEPLVGRFIEMYESGLSTEQITVELRAEYPWLLEQHVDEAMRRSGYKRKKGKRKTALHKDKAAKLYSLYRELGSCSLVAEAWCSEPGNERMTRQSVFQLLRSHGYVLNPGVINAERITWEGIEFSFHRRKDGECYWRETKGERRPLHRMVWEKAHGPIKPGSEIHFRDGDQSNCDLSNLVLRQRDAKMRQKTCGACLAKIVPREGEDPWDFNQRLSCSYECSRILARSAFSLRKMTCHWPHDVECDVCWSREVFPLRRVNRRTSGLMMEYWIWCPRCRAPFRKWLQRGVGEERVAS